MLNILPEKHKKWLPALFFVFGFIFDAYMLKRIDELFSIAQQAVYLILSGALVCATIVEYQPQNPKFAKIWSYHEEVLHFFLGTLLNAYTIFYFKSASTFTSVLFVVILATLLYINESKRIRGAGNTVRMILFSMCLSSYFMCIVPIALGFIGAFPFLLAIVISTLAAYPMYVFLKRRQLEKLLFKPLAGTQLVFLVLYFLQLIPPVPLSASYMGIYHEITKENGEWLLASTRPRWKFWQNGDQSFAARPGDKLYFFMRVFSPTRFQENLQIRWLLKEARAGWTLQDTIPLKVAGGREEGYRAMTIKNNYQPGDWRVEIETSDHRELGRLYFTVDADTTTEEREMRIERQ